MSDHRVRPVVPAGVALLVPRVDAVESVVAAAGLHVQSGDDARRHGYTSRHVRHTAASDAAARSSAARSKEASGRLVTRTSTQDSQ